MAMGNTIDSVSAATTPELMRRLLASFVSFSATESFSSSLTTPSPSLSATRSCRIVEMPSAPPSSICPVMTGPPFSAAFRENDVRENSEAVGASAPAQSSKRLYVASSTTDGASERAEPRRARARSRGASGSSTWRRHHSFGSARAASKRRGRRALRTIDSAEDEGLQAS